MMCYKDMTFCSGGGCVNFGPCFRSLTEEVKAKAKAYGLPIAQFTSPKELECYAPPPTRPSSK